MCVWRDRKTVWAYQGQNVITHSCVGNNVPNRANDSVDLKPGIADNIHGYPDGWIAYLYAILLHCDAEQNSAVVNAIALIAKLVELIVDKKGVRRTDEFAEIEALRNGISSSSRNRPSCKKLSSSESRLCPLQVPTPSAKVSSALCSSRESSNAAKATNHSKGLQPNHLIQRADLP